MIWQETQSYGQDIAEVVAVRPGSPIAADPAVGVRVDLNDADDQVVGLVGSSRSGRVFSIWESATGGTFCGATDLSAADCPAGAPPGHSQRGF